jgi:hypothetical protein
VVTWYCVKGASGPRRGQKSTLLHNLFTNLLSACEMRTSGAFKKGSSPCRSNASFPRPISFSLSITYYERIEDPIFLRGVKLIDSANVAALQAHLREHPALAHQRVFFEGGNYFRNPTLLEFVAENPIRRNTLPENIVEVAKAILDAGPKKKRRR